MLPQKQILVVEDNNLNREMLTEILSDQYTVLEAENGQEALEILKQCKDGIALILLDVMMPVMDGFAFLDTIKKDADLALIPVIVMTQSDSVEDEVTALTHGATDFVPKPYRPQVILHRVASIINLRETAALVNQFKYDRLTGLYSKEFFYQKAREILNQNPEKEYVILCSDIENFKLFNDLFGMSAGDRLLCAMAKYGMEQIGEQGICGRISADRFVALCQRRSTWGEETFAGHVSRINEFSGFTGSVMVKFGIYEIVDRTVPVEHMCDRALLAADRIKGQYNKFFSVYNDTLRDQLLREQAITDSMESALTEGQFTIYLQPKYSLNDDGLAGAEALVRWIHPEWGIISPGEFIPLFEKNGFITLLDQYVWEQVCVLLRDWREKGYATLPVSVNVSRADVYQSDLPDTLLGLVRKYGVDPGDLHLEITESAYTENPSQIISTVERLRRLGFIIEMDDFGSGYSSLNMLNQMKMDILKLDMKFIQTETAKPMEQGILRFIVGLARWMNLSVVAEGVETREQLERLREIGCDYVQGYFFARPMPCREYEDLLKTHIIEHRASAQKTAQTSDAVQSLLVVDEDAAYRRMIHQIFDGQYQILEASDAQGALDCVAIHGHDTIFAVMLSMTLPEQGAALLLKELRQDPTLWRIPILATMPQSEGLEKQALDLDADDFICKPHTQRGLRKRIAHLLSMTMHQERERVLQDEAYRDYLTGLLNRRGFHAAIDSLRQEDLPLAVYLFDVDDLKKINDNHGHGMGDEMLRFFGELLQRRTRDGDILCRYGGDEFVVILRHIDSVETILKKGREICLGLDDWRLPDGVHATCSCGIALCGPDEKPSVKLIERADTALYRVKQKDKGGCCLWEKQMEEST